MAHMVYLLQFSIYLAGSKNVSARPPVRPGYGDTYHSRSYYFIERQKRWHNVAIHMARLSLNLQIGCWNSFRYNFRPEIDNDIISGVAVDNVGVDVRVKFGDS